MTIIVLPWPPKPLTPNHRSRSHWPRTNALKKAREDGYYATKAAKVGICAGDVPIILRATFNPPGRYHYDRDGLLSSMKGYFDGIADALGVDDFWFRPEPPIVGEPIKGGRVTVEVIA
jgi:crossover junction endodeoxyribonuclease RusA